MDAATIGGLLVAALTELLSKFAEQIGHSLPPFAKSLIALLASAFLPALAGIHPFSGPYAAALNGLVVWVLATLAHDLGLSQSGGLAHPSGVDK